MAGHHTVLLVIVLTAAMYAAASSEESSTRPSILMPVADTPLGSFEGADGPVADDALEDEDAAPVGAPLGTTMTGPKPLLFLTPPGFPAEGEDADGTSGATAVSALQLGCSAAVVVVAAAGVFAF